MSVVARSPIVVAARGLHLRPGAVALGAVAFVFAFATSLALVLYLTASWRDAMTDATAAGDAVLFAGAALVMSAALGGFLAGLSSRVTDSVAGGAHAVLALVFGIAVVALAWWAGASLSSIPSPAPVTAVLFVACAVAAAAVAGRVGARRNADEEADAPSPITRR